MTTDPADPVSTWPTEAVRTALERGDLDDWRRLAAEIDREPWGPTARRVEEVLSVSRPYGVAERPATVLTAHTRLTGDTILVVTDVTIRDLRNRGGEIVDRVLAGEQLTVTRDGTPVAALRPLRRRGVDPATLLARWHVLPPLDADRFRRDVDEVLDASL